MSSRSQLIGGIVEAGEAWLLAEGTPREVLWEYEQVWHLGGHRMFPLWRGCSEAQGHGEPWREGDVMTRLGYLTVCYPVGVPEGIKRRDHIHISERYPGGDTVAWRR